MLTNLPASLCGQLRSAQTKLVQIEAAVNHLGRLMEDVLGEECQYMLSLEAGAAAILISPGMHRGTPLSRGPVDIGEDKPNGRS